MAKASREFQVFAKPIGARCNLGCHYCYYLGKEALHPKGATALMADDLLEEYIVQHIEASAGPVVSFSWHGGEPLLAGIDYFRKIIRLQRKYQPAGQRIRNAIQTNGTLLDEDWCRFLSAESFGIGLSLDGPRELHDQYRVTKGQGPTHEQVMSGLRLLQQYRIPFDILCVVHAQNVNHPLEVYRFFKKINAPYIGFLPLVEREPESDGGVSHRSVPAEAFGIFLSTIFDEWVREDIGRIRVQIFEEAAATALGEEHALCIFRQTCGEIPVVEQNGDFYSCDHFVDDSHRLGNIRQTPLVELLESPVQRTFGESKRDRLPRYCQTCDVLAMCNGACPKDRFLSSPDGEEGLNYLCAGYKRFFTHCQPFMTQLSAVHRRQAEERQAAPFHDKPAYGGAKTGRNDPCPCGSGKKYKKCCLDKLSK